MRNMLDVAVANQADRVASAAVTGRQEHTPTRQELITITADDLPPLLEHPEEFFGLYL
jgi:hypothetical protein